MCLQALSPLPFPFLAIFFPRQRACSQASVSLDARRDFDLADQGDHLVSLRAMASNVPPAPATEEAIVFYEEGKGGENFRKKNKFRCKVKREEACRSLRIVFGKSIDNHKRSLHLHYNNNNKFIQYYHFVQVLPIKITIINS